MLYAGVVAAELYNTSPYRDKNAKWVSPFDFVPKDKKYQAPEQTLAEQIRVLTAVMGCGPGVN